ncbi:MAG: hypothetical protein HQ483_07750 [Rhodospirillales bacterium]|nr:hypothetical protein [Rhodospirillales bacterium]
MVQRAVIGVTGYLRNWLVGPGLGLWLCLSGGTALHAADNTLLIADSLRQLDVDFGARLQQSLQPDYPFEIKSGESEANIFQQVLAAADTVGIGHADVFANYVNADPQSAGRLEFYRGIPACLLLVVSRATPVQSLDDLVKRLRSLTTTAPLIIDVGPQDASPAALYATLKQVVAEFEGVTTEHAGGFRALSRVASGQIDATVILAYAPFQDQRIRTLMQSDKVKVLPLYSHSLGKRFNGAKSPYLARKITLGDGKWFVGAGESLLTVCTSLGVVANTGVDPRLSEALARITLSGDLLPPGSRLSTTIDAGLSTVTESFGSARKWLEDAVKTGRDWWSSPAEQTGPADAGTAPSLTGEEPAGGGPLKMPGGDGKTPE